MLIDYYVTLPLAIEVPTELATRQLSLSFHVVYLHAQYQEIVSY